MKPEIEDLLKRASCVAGYDRTGEPWHFENAGSLVPKLTDTVRDQDAEIVQLRRHVIRMGETIKQLCGLLRTTEAILDDAAGVGTRATVMRNAIAEVLGERSIHEMDTIPPAPPVEFEPKQETVI